MSVAVKICGLSTARAMDAALEAGADMVGLVFYGPSPRNVDTSTGHALAGRARGKARIVAMVVDADDQTLSTIAADVDPDFFQAHGSETPERVQEISALTNKPVIKAIKVRGPQDVASANDYARSAAMILYDAKAPADLAGALPGGNGLAFDWSLLSSDKGAGAFMLSGGLDAGNVSAAISVTNAPIVDVSSGVESAPGVKDDILIRKFIEAAKSASQDTGT